MKRLDSYIGKSVIGATAFAWLVVATLDALFMFIGQLGDVGRGDYGLTDALAFVPCIDTALVVVEDDVTSEHDLKQAIEMLAVTDIIGTVLNKSVY